MSENRHIIQITFNYKCIPDMIYIDMSDISKRLQLRHFRLIQAISETGQLSEAAEKLSITQPAASRSLAETERILGHPLFIRHPKGMKPNVIGSALCRRAEAILAELDLAEAEVAAVISGHSGTVRVGAVTGAAVGYTVPAIQALKREAPDVVVQVIVAPSVQLMDGLLEGDLDFILARVPPAINPRRLKILHGRAESLAFIVRDGHQLSYTTDVNLTDLVDLPWIMQSRGMPIRAGVETAYIEAGIEVPSDIVDSASLLVTLAYIASSNAVSPVAKEVSNMLTQSELGGFHELQMNQTITLPPYHLIHQKDRQLNPVTRQLLNLVNQRLKSGNPAEQAT